MIGEESRCVTLEVSKLVDGLEKVSNGFIVSAVFEVDNKSPEGLESATIESAIARFVGTLVITLGAGKVSEKLDILCIVDNVKYCPKLLDTDIFETLIDSSPCVEN